MRNRKQKKYLYLLLLLLAVSIGYAALATTLKINGSATISKNSWNVHWDDTAANIKVTDGSVTETKPTIGAEQGDPAKTLVSWSVNLSLPGDFYEFTVDAINEGSIDAMITNVESKIGNSVISNVVNGEIVEATPSPLPSYLTYTVTYGDGTPIGLKHLLAKETGRETYKVRVEVNNNLTPEILDELPENGQTYTFTFKVDYAQADDTATDRNGVNFNTLLAQIKANPSSYKPQEQTLTDDIGVDKHGNIVNMDWWIDKDYCPGQKVYIVNTSTNEIRLGSYLDESDIYCDEAIEAEGIPYGSNITGATSSENIENGEWKLTLPQYIYDSTTQEVYPVTILGRVFADVWSVGSTHITQVPEIPDTVKVLSGTFFFISSLKNVTIPKQIEEVDGAFEIAYDYEGENNTLAFEEGSQLKVIKNMSFVANNIKGNVVLPQTVEYIGQNAFKGNIMTSVTFPSSAKLYGDDGIEINDPYQIFDSGVTINHQY